MKKLKVKQVRSSVGRKEDQRRTLVALGITKLGHEALHNDTPQVRGMIKKVSHLVCVSEEDK